ncbi:MAG: SDR family oxidoreductase [Candidatus Neomarinimicrobiota bacterium]
MSDWMLILGCSTGFGGATARKLAEHGYGVIGFHFDRGDIRRQAEKFCQELNEMNEGRTHFFNKNAAFLEIMDESIPKIEEITGGKPLKLLLHSIAFGTITNFFGEKPVTQRQLEMTVHVMGTSLLYWVQKLMDAELLGQGSRVLGLTSEGNYVAMEGYGPVSVAKAALESITRQIGWELGKYGITANCIQAGVTPTRALTKISDRWEEWVEKTKKRNPMGRTTRPEDVANLVYLMLQPGADFINCSIIHVDGGEHRSGILVA